MALPKTISLEGSRTVDLLNDLAQIELSRPPSVVDLDEIVLVEKSTSRGSTHPRPMLPSRVAVIGNYLPRKCGIATFTTDLCDAIHAEYGATELLALPVNDTEEGYSYPARIRFELSQDDLVSYQQAADFL